MGILGLILGCTPLAHKYPCTLNKSDIVLEVQPGFILALWQHWRYLSLETWSVEIIPAPPGSSLTTSRSMAEMRSEPGTFGLQLTVHTFGLQAAFGVLLIYTQSLSDLSSKWMFPEPWGVSTWQLLGPLIQHCSTQPGIIPAEDWQLFSSGLGLCWAFLLHFLTINSAPCSLASSHQCLQSLHYRSTTECVQAFMPMSPYWFSTCCVANLPCVEWGIFLLMVTLHDPGWSGVLLVLEWTQVKASWRGS